MIQNKEYSRFKWSHNLWLHRMLVRLYNRFMKLVPFGVKYGFGKRLRKDKPPYFLIRPGSVVMQIGAPKDTLRAGRSRGMYFILFSGRGGKAIIVEPNQDSLEAYRKVCQQRGLVNAEFIPSAVWSETRLLRVYINDAHPATNFIEGTVDYSQDRLKEYRVVEIPASTVDQILADHKVPRIDLVSITTNGSERTILKGMCEGKTSLHHAVQSIVYIGRRVPVIIGLRDLVVDQVESSRRQHAARVVRPAKRTADGCGHAPV